MFLLSDSYVMLKPVHAEFSLGPVIKVTKKLFDVDSSGFGVAYPLCSSTTADELEEPS